VHPFIQFGDSFSIPTYGLVYLTAFLTGTALIARLATSLGVPFWRMFDIAFQFCIAGEIGARLMFVIVEWDAFVSGSISLHRFLVSGRVVLGGIVAGVLYAVYAIRKNRFPVLAFLDASLAPVPVAMGIGRLGCLLSGCCYGKPTDLWWGITFTNPDAQRISGTPLHVPLHPTQILQAIDGLVLGAILIVSFYRRRWDGQTFSLFLLLAGALRFGWEMLRGDRRGAAAGLATSQWIGIFMIAAGTALFLWTRRRGERSTYTPQA
jgi:phosphatidylglycerol:prolipoprotein diacylglycerol transferase